MQQPRLRIIVFVAAFLLEVRSASAADISTLIPAVLCAPSAAELHEASSGGSQTLCLLRIAPLFDGTSVEVIPRAAPKHWGARLALRF